MQEFLHQLRFYLKSVWRNRWYMHAIIWPVCIGGWIFVYLIPNEYESSARVFVDNESILKPLLQGLAVPTDLGQQVEVMKQALLSRPNLEKVAHTTGLDRRAKTPEDLEELYASLMKKIFLLGRGSEKIYSITYTDHDPKMSQRVVQALLSTFVESSMGGRRTDSDRAQQFLDDQIAELEKRLKEAEDQLTAFKRKNAGLMPSEGHGYYERLQAAKTTLENAQLELNEEQRRRDELVKQQEGEEPTFGIVGMPEAVSDASSLDQRIQSLHSRLDDLLLKYTDAHPDVISLRHTIAQLEAQREQERKRTATQMRASPIAGVADLRVNPVYQQLKITLSQSEATIAALKVRVNEYEQRVGQLQNMVNTVPLVEAQLEQLNRDYDVNKRNYEALVARRESARITDDAARSAESVKFKVIDPPREPLIPIRPNRPLLITAVLLAGLILGAVFAIFMTQIKPTYVDRQMLASKTKRPILGSVSKVWTPQSLAQYRRDLTSFVSVSIILLCVYSGYLAYLVKYQ